MTLGAEAPAPPGQVYCYNGGLLRRGRVRHILELSGHAPRLGWPSPDAWVAVWGHSPVARRGHWVAQKRGARLLRVEDAFLRSVMPGRSGQPPLGLVLDRSGAHYDPRQPSDLEKILSEDPLSDPALLGRAEAAIARIRAQHLSKYCGFDPNDTAALPAPGFVLVVDQTRGDASVRLSGGDRARFRQMLALAAAENPGRQIVVKSHPETGRGYRPGHLEPSDMPPGAILLEAPVSPWHLLDRAAAVYTLSSQLGFEAILAGHRPVVLGQPFYMGWGLSDDRTPLPRRQRHLSAAQLFAGAMIRYPLWYEPFHDRLGTLEEAMAALEAESRAWRDDHRGWVAAGMRPWKRPALRGFLGRHGRLRFAEGARARRTAEANGARLCTWASRRSPALGDASVVAVEDGFLRSRGLGADLVPPVSLVLDDLGIYFDATRPSRLEQILAEATPSADDLHRAEALRHQILAADLSKYNLPKAHNRIDIPKGHRILVPGQVEDDASIRLGTAPDCASNAALLKATRAANPSAVILYKPHPDVEAGLRPGHIHDTGAADLVLSHVSITEALAEADEVWTLTSLTGFEALLRGLPVTCLGAPFYAGWGLTDDRGPTPARRGRKITLAQLVHATLIAYPRYQDPITGLPCPPEIAAERLADSAAPPPPNRLMAKLQGHLIGLAPLWRRR